MTPQDKAKSIQRALNRNPGGAKLTVDGIIGPATEAAFNDLKALTTQGSVTIQGSGKAGWYSQYKGKYIWIDNEDEPDSNALGVPDDQQGCSFYDHSTL